MSLLTELRIFWVLWCYKHVASPRLFVRLKIQAWNLQLVSGSEATMQLVARVAEH
jgi:hypothetical protein